MGVELVSLAASIVAALITQFFGARASKQRTPRSTSRTAPAEDVVVLQVGPFTYAWLSFVLVAVVAGAVLLIDGAPPQADFKRGEFEPFFETSAQVTAGLLIAFALELATRGRRGISGEEGSEVVQAFVFIAIGQASALAALLPSAPHWFQTAALALVPAAVAGALVGVLTIAHFVGSRRPGS